MFVSADRGNQSEDNTSDAEETQEVQLLRKTLRYTGNDAMLLKVLFL